MGDQERRAETPVDAPGTLRPVEPRREDTPRLFALVNLALVVTFLLLFAVFDVFGDDEELGTASPLAWIFHFGQGLCLWGLGMGVHALLTVCRIPGRLARSATSLFFALLLMLLFFDMVYVVAFRQHLDFSILWYARQPGILKDLAISLGQIVAVFAALVVLFAAEMALFAAERRWRINRYVGRRGQLRLGIGAFLITATAWSCYLNIHPVQATRDVAMVPWFPARAWNLDFPALWSWLPVEPQSVLWEREVDHDYIEHSLENVGYAAFHERYRLPDQIVAKKDWNILVIAAESWRWDMLNKEIMPNLTALLRDGAWASPHHFSTGSRTPEGLYGLLSGQVPFYWYPHYHRRSHPIFFPLLKRLGYRTQIWTSSSFAYGDLDKTLFGAGVDKITTINQLKTTGDTRSWKQRRLELEDEQMVAAYLADLDEREPGPSFDFLFFYCTHYNYYYRDEFEKYRPASSADFSPGIFMRSRRDELFNRYKNSAHYLDHLLGGVVDALRKRGQLEKTILVITADHGEEFFERGRFGHSMSTNSYQTGVPLVIHMPGGFASQYTVTSNADVVPTVLGALQVSPSFQDALTGKNLLDYDAGNNRALVSALGPRRYPMEFALVEDNVKFVFLNQADRVVLKRVLDLDDNQREDPPAEDVERSLDHLVRLKDYFRLWRDEK